MGIEEVQQDIEKRIAVDLEVIEKEACAEAEAIICAAEEKAKVIREEAERDASRRSEELHKREISAANLDAKKSLLMAKKEVLEEAWQKASKKLAALNEKERSEIMKTLLKKGLNELDAKYAYSNEKDKSIVKQLAAGLNWQKADCYGGVILENAEKNVRVNYAFEILFEDVKQATLKQLSKKLFGD